MRNNVLLNTLFSAFIVAFTSNLASPAFSQDATPDNFTVYTPAADPAAKGSTEEMSVAEAAKVCGVDEAILSTWQTRYCVAVGGGEEIGAEPSSSSSAAGG